MKNAACFSIWEACVFAFKSKNQKSKKFFKFFLKTGCHFGFQFQIGEGVKKPLLNGVPPFAAFWQLNIQALRTLFLMIARRRVRHNLSYWRISENSRPETRTATELGNDSQNDNDTSLWGWRRTRQRWNPYDTVQLTVALVFPTRAGCVNGLPSAGGVENKYCGLIHSWLYKKAVMNTAKGGKAQDVKL